MGRPKKINLNDLKQTNGNLEAPTTSVKEVIAASILEVKKEEIKPTEVKAYAAHGALTPNQSDTINSILRKYKKDAYGKYVDHKHYSQEINKMGISELHAHAIDVSVIPTSDKDRLIKNLEVAFGTHMNKNVPKVFPPSSLSAEGAKEIEKILAAKLGKK